MSCPTAYWRSLAADPTTIDSKTERSRRRQTKSKSEPESDLKAAVRHENNDNDALFPPRGSWPVRCISLSLSLSLTLSLSGL